jgi:hypothetical protein
VCVYVSGYVYVYVLKGETDRQRETKKFEVFMHSNLANKMVIALD